MSIRFTVKYTNGRISRTEFCRVASIDTLSLTREMKTFLEIEKFKHLDDGEHINKRSHGHSPKRITKKTYAKWFSIEFVKTYMEHNFGQVVELDLVPADDYSENIKKPVKYFKKNANKKTQLP